MKSTRPTIALPVNTPTARVLSHPNRSSSKPQPRITLLDSVGPDFDVCDELTYSLDAYNGEESITFRGLPNIIRYTVEMLRERVAAKSPPPMRAVYTCCIYGGIDVLRGNQHIRALTRMKRLFLNKTHGSDVAGAYELMQMYQMMDKFEIQLSDPMNSGSVAKCNTQVTKEIRAMVSDTARRTGLSGNEVSKLAMVATLTEQTEIREDFRAILQTMYDSTMRACDCRCDVIKTLLARIGVDVKDAEEDE